MMKGFRFSSKPLFGWMAAILLTAAPAEAQEACSNPLGLAVAVEGKVMIRRAEAAQWQSLALGDALCPRDRIQVEALSRAALSFRDFGVLRLDQSTFIELPSAPSDSERSLFNLISGVLHFFSNDPRAFNVHTPFVNAGVEGTEFLVRSEPARTFLVVFEGRVTARNPQGEVTLSSNEAATAAAGTPPVVEMLVRPRDAVQWALYYPPIFPPGGDPSPGQVEISRAAQRLSVGRADEAMAIINRLLGEDPGNAEALALRSIIAITRNDRDAALMDARRSVDLNPQSAPVRIALSYAYQANFDIEAARDALLEAVEAQPDNALAHARLAEVWLMLGYRDRALASAERAASIAPDLAQVQSVLGFAALSGMDRDKAATAFRRAIELDQANWLPRLGLGLSKIRGGDLAGGRGDLEIAAVLDPNRATVRNYLGKAYFEERRQEKAENALDMGEALDPLDPTGPFYSAILKQSENRPVEALHDLERAIDLNNNRAVYRSSLLLDEDLAVRQISLGRIYNDLGFEQRAVSEAAKSLSLDPANYSAHRFLSDIYAERPRHEIARVSELLQSQLLQPLNANPIQPRLSIADLNIASGLGPADVTFNEFNPLFARDGFRITGSTIFGNNGTFGEEVAASALIGRLALSAGQFHSESDGFRPNADYEHNIYNVFAQAELTDQLSVQAEYRYRKTDQGDLAQDFRPSNAERNASFFVKEEIFRLGARYAPTPNIDLIGTVIHSDRSAGIMETISSIYRFDSLADQDGLNGEGQMILRQEKFNILLGAGATRVDQDESNIIARIGGAPVTPEPPDKSRVDHQNTYAYANFFMPSQVTWTLGLSYDVIDDEYYNYEDTRLNPKFGIQWDVFDWLRVRAAAFNTTKKPLIVNQTIEPSQVAGFNQFFDDFNGAKSKRKAIGVDVDLTSSLLAGFEYSLRNVDVPLARPSGPPIFLDQDENLHRGFLYWTPRKDLALTAEALWERIEPPLEFREVKSFSAPFTVRYYNPGGFFAQLGATFVRQSVDPAPTGTTTTRDQFTVIDAAVGYRLPNRRAIISLEIRNLLDEEFLYADYDYVNNTPTSSGARFLPSRSILGRISIGF